MTGGAVSDTAGEARGWTDGLAVTQLTAEDSGGLSEELRVVIARASPAR